MRRSDPLIVGGGPAGSALAILLGKAGARPVLLERQRETGDALCGGFLSWRTIEALGRLGVSLPHGHRVDRLRIFAGGQMGEARLPGPALGLSRQSLDSFLLAKAGAAGAGIERGIAVREWRPGEIETSDGAVLRPDSLFLATGKHDVRGLGRPRPEPESQTLGIRVRLSPHPALDRLIGGAIELHLFGRGYCGMVLQEGGRGNLCLAVRKTRLAESGGDPDRLLAEWAAASPAFAERLAHREGGADAIGAVPYGWIARETASGIFRLGDQAAVIPSLAGEGIGMAIASATIAERAWRNGATAPRFRGEFAEAAALPIRLARGLWHLAERERGALLIAQGVHLFPALARRFAEWTRIRH